MYDGLDGEDASDPAVQQEVRAVRPVGDPEQEVVAAREENDKRQETIPNMSSAIADIGEYLLFLREAPWMRLRTTLVHRAQNDIEGREEEYIRGLPDSRCVAEQPRQRTNLIRAHCRRIHKIWFEFVEYASRERQLANECANDRNAEA